MFDYPKQEDLLYEVPLLFLKHEKEEKKKKNKHQQSPKNEETKKKNKPQKSPPSTITVAAETAEVHLLPDDTKRCKRCEKYYSSDHEKACRYHSGLHSGLRYNPYWSCCKQPQKDAPGCTYGFHDEDSKTSHFIAERPVVNDPAPIEIAQPNVDPDSTEKHEEENEIYVKKDDGTTYYKHRLSSTDTLRGLAVKYSVTPSSIKKANRIFGMDDEIHLKDFILIPWDNTVSAVKETNSNDDLIKQFKVELHISTEEAKFYLSDAEWDISLARTTYSQDLAFEKNNPPMAAANKVKLGKKHH